MTIDFTPIPYKEEIFQEFYSRLRLIASFSDLLDNEARAALHAKFLVKQAQLAIDRGLILALKELEKCESQQRALSG